MPKCAHAASGISLFGTPFVAVVAFAIVAVAGCSSEHRSVMPPSTSRGTSNIAGALPGTSPTPAPANLASCGGGDTTALGCHARPNPNFPVAATPSGGLTPAQLRSAYGLPNIGGALANGPLVAVVDAFEDHTAEADLATYRAQFGLPLCTSLNGCFTKVIISGGVTAPGQVKKLFGATTGTTWADEIALDLAMVSAACPSCRIMLVEAGGNDLDSLAAAVSTAASFRPAAISATWGVPESGNQGGIDAGAQAAFNQPGIPIAVSAGDAGGPQFPATSPYVTSVGGTTLTPGGGPRGWTETVWASTGTGCSTMFTTPAWQARGAACGGRSVPDVSFVADYNTGVAVYSSAQGGWIVLGGTSVGAPFIAGLYAAASDYGAATVGAPALYANLGGLNVVGGGAVSPKGLAGF